MIATAWPRRPTLRLADEEVTQALRVMLGQPYRVMTMEVLAPESFDSLAVAARFGLVFVDQGSLRGWIEPSDADQHRWDLFLMPGHPYPPGHAPPPPTLATDTENE